MNTMLVIFSITATTGIFILARYFILENRRDRIPVIIYHRLVSDEDLMLCRKFSYVVSLSNFEQQMRYLKEEGYVPIDLNDYLFYKEHPHDLPEKPVIISFDDGYENNYRYAFPILKKYGFKAVIYSITDPDAPLFLQFELPEKLLSPEQMKELSDNGISIQGHTATHPYLKEIDEKGIYRELTECKEIIEKITGKPVVHMAVPYGSMDDRLFKIARDVGYKTLSIPGKGTINLASDPYDIKRLSVHNNTTIKQFSMLVGSPTYAVLNRIYAMSHLFIRKTFGRKFEKKLKVIFAQYGLDDAEKLAKIGIVAFIIIVFLYLFL
jgi:peptidoglycan/xylan/chitin deacetylase (PgdA/CDA1 family)